MRLVVAVLVGLVGCGGAAPAAKTTPVTPPATKPTDPATKQAPSEPEKVGVALQVTPGEAKVTIDDLLVGQASELDPVFALAPGLHTLVIKQPGYKTYRMEFSVTDKTETFVIHLDPAK